MSDILAQFKALKLYGMASSYAELRQQNTPDVADSFNFADTLLNQLLQAETTDATSAPFAIRHKLPDSRCSATYMASTSISPKSISN